MTTNSSNGAGSTTQSVLGTVTTGTWSATNIALNKGGTNASLTANNGGIFYSTASAGAILSGTATANQLLMSGSSTTPAWSTATYPSTTTTNQLLYSSGTNTVAELATANSSILVTSAGGVPSLSQTLPFTLPVTSGGTGVSTMTTAYAPVIAGTTATGALQVASTGLSTAGYVLTSTGSSSAPTWQAAPGAGTGPFFKVVFTPTNPAVVTYSSNVASVVYSASGGDHWTITFTSSTGSANWYPMSSTTGAASNDAGTFSSLATGSVVMKFASSPASCCAIGFA